MVCGSSSVSGMLIFTVFNWEVVVSGIDSKGEICTCVAASVSVMYSSKRSMILLTPVLSCESAGEMLMSLGGVTSLGPPEGGTMLAQLPASRISRQ